ncbi:hypothetical protein BV25DRAFT_1804810, partial [Artomyces pyxidatus]
FLSFFYLQPARKKVVKVAVGTKRKRGGSRSTTAADTSAANESVVIQEGADSSGFTAVEQDFLNEDHDPGDLPDPAKAAHDDSAVSSVKGQAVREAAAYGVILTAREEKTALGLFPKVAGLARRLHDSPTLQEKFERLVVAMQGEHDQKKRLDRRVPTRWNSDYACLAAHIAFKAEIRKLTTEDGLEEYALTNEQWALAEELKDVLQVSEVTDLFSQSEVPLVHEVVPMLETLEQQLTHVRDSVELPNTIRVAAHASLIMVGKYYALSDDCEVYRIAIVMCPDKKVAWFDNNPGWRPEDREEVKRLVNTRWSESYATRTILAQTAAGQGSSSATTSTAQEKVRQQTTCTTLSRLIMLIYSGASQNGRHLLAQRMMQSPTSILTASKLTCRHLVSLNVT